MIGGLKLRFTTVLLVREAAWREVERSLLRISCGETLPYGPLSPDAEVDLDLTFLGVLFPDARGDRARTFFNIAKRHFF